MTVFEAVALLSVLIFWAFGAVLTLAALRSLLAWMLKMYKELRNDMLQVWMVETMILTYKRRRKEVDAILAELDRQDEEHRAAVLRQWEAYKSKMKSEDCHD